MAGRRGGAVTGGRVRRFERRFVLRAPVREVARFHEDPGALRRLTPVPVALLDPPTPLREGMLVRFRLWLGPVPVRWEARVREVSEDGFVDVMERGPFLAWRHEHRYRHDETGGGTEVRDVVEAELAPGLRGLAGRILWAGVRAGFAYRAWRTRRALRRPRRAAGEAPPRSLK